MLAEEIINGLVYLIDEKKDQDAAKAIVNKMNRFERKEALDKIIVRALDGVDFYLDVLGKKEESLSFQEKEVLKRARISIEETKAKEAQLKAGPQKVTAEIIEITNISRKKSEENHAQAR